MNESQILTSPFQAGGTGITLGDELTPRKILNGVDSTGLGRWAWSTVTGKNGFTTMLISAYRPTNNCRDQGSVWSQHRRYFLEREEDREPIEASEQDLSAKLQKWIQEGSHIVLGMDANEDVRHGGFPTRLIAMGLREAITTHHSHLSPPATQNRNQSRTPIDGIWISGNLEVTKAGYTAFGGGCPSDHRGLWLDITTSSMLGHRPPRILKPVAHRLSSRDPRIWRKYCNLVTDKYQTYMIPEMAAQLAALTDQYHSSDVSNQNLQPITDLHHQIHCLTRTIQQETATRIRKIKRGEVPWSPRLQRLRNEIDLWDRVVKRHEGHATSSTIIRRLALRCEKIFDVEGSTVHTATEALKEAQSLPESQTRVPSLAHRTPPGTC